MTRLVALGLAGALWLCSCGGTGGSMPDAGDGTDGTVDGDAGSGDDAGIDGYAFVVPGPLELCSVFREGRTAIQEYALHSRIGLTPGEFPLPVEVRSFPITFVQSVVFGPDRIAGTPQGEGSCQVELTAEGQGFLCEQTFDVQGVPLRIRYPISFPTGEPSRIKLFDLEYTSYPMMEGFLGAGQDPNTEQLQFAHCTLGALGTYRMTLQWEGGDRTVLDQKGWTYPFTTGRRPGYTGETGPACLSGAVVTVGGTERVVNDYFQLVYAAGHHNWYEKYLVILDPPLGETHGLYCEDTGEVGMEAPEKLLYLGADLDPGNPQRTANRVGAAQVELIP